MRLVVKLSVLQLDTAESHVIPGHQPLKLSSTPTRCLISYPNVAEIKRKYRVGLIHDTRVETRTQFLYKQVNPVDA